MNQTRCALHTTEMNLTCDPKCFKLVINLIPWVPEDLCLSCSGYFPWFCSYSLKFHFTSCTAVLITKEWESRMRKLYWLVTRFKTSSVKWNQMHKKKIIPFDSDWGLHFTPNFSFCLCTVWETGKVYKGLPKFWTHAQKNLFKMISFS